MRNIRLLYLHAVDMPSFDDWSALAPDALPAGFTLRWIFALHNGHRDVLTKLQIWILYGLDHWNIRHQQIVNSLIYILVVAALARLIRRAAPSHGWGTQFSFMIFLFTLNNPLVTLGWISTCHFSLLFSFLAAQLLFSEKQDSRSLAWGVGAVWLAFFSYSFGAVFCLTLMPMYSAFKWGRAASAANPDARRREQHQLAGVAAGCALAFILWQPWKIWAAFPEADHLPFNNGQYFLWLSSLISHGFCWARFPPLSIRLICLGACVVPLASAWRRRKSLSGPEWSIHAVTIAILAGLAAITLARGNGHMSGFSTHYNEFACMLVPSCAACWHLLLREKPRLKAAVLVSLWLYCLIGSRSSHYWDSTYIRLFELAKEQNFFAARDYFRYGSLPKSSEYWTKDDADRAKQTKVSFYRRLAPLLPLASDGPEEFDFTRDNPGRRSFVQGMSMPWDWKTDLRSWKSELILLGPGYGVFREDFTDAMPIPALQMRDDALYFYPSSRPDHSKREADLLLYPRYSVTNLAPVVHDGYFIGIRMPLSWIILTRQQAHQIARDGPQPLYRSLDAMATSITLDEEGFTMTPLAHCRKLDAVLLKARKAFPIKDPQRGEFLLFARQGRAQITAGSHSLISRSGNVIRIPRGLASQIHVEPLGSEPFVALQVRFHHAENP